MFLENLLLLSLPLIVTAYPINVLNSSGGATTFEVLLAVALSVTVLVLTKFLYMRYRRTHVSYNFSDCSLQSSQRSTTSFFYNSEKLVKPGKAAFLVGFFGSPSWETSVKTLYDGPSVYSNQLQFQSRRSQKSARRTSRFSISEFGGLRRSTRYSDTNDSRALSNTLVALSHPPPHFSASLPTYPADARTNSSGRRHSLPVTRQMHSEHPTDRRRRPSSLKSSRSHRFESLPIPGLRLVNLANSNPDLLPQTSFLDFEPFSPTPSSMHSRSRSKSSRASSCIPPLPPLPASVLLSPLPDLPESISNEGRSYISSPYALSPKQTSLNETKLSPVIPGADSRMTITRRPSQTSGTLPRIKVQPSRSPSLRSRKSPIVGPSPLRIVTLPEGSLANLNKDIDKDLLPSIPSLSSSTGSVTAPASRAGEWSKHQNYADLGIGYPSSWGLGLGLEEGGTSQIQSEIDSENRLSVPCRLSQATSTQSQMPSSPDADAMLGIIQELVEETSQWDDSLFMDTSFKALIENSRSTSADSPLSSSKSSHHSRQPSGPRGVVLPVPSPPSSRNSSESARPRTHSSSSVTSAKSKAPSVTVNTAAVTNAPGNTSSHHSSSAIGTERKLSPKSILKKTLMMPSRSVEFELGLVGLDAVRMENFRMSAYESPRLYGGGYDEPIVDYVMHIPTMPGAYEHGSVLTPLQEISEEQEQEAEHVQVVQKLVFFR
ncbi:MAG: hypothetical protein NXY57DRAFT_1034659 [Lentinula lateritia]|nr:MAG: hypothetical protein NXY57DRAFT_1034659 [Lentinula lateritia]